MHKFKEDLRTAVFTTKYILKRESPILFVFHFKEDGSWQFSGPEKNIKNEDYRVISLEEAINIDNSILQISNLPLGGRAYRENIESPWKTQLSTFGGTILAQNKNLSTRHGR